MQYHLPATRLKHSSRIPPRPSTPLRPFAITPKETLAPGHIHQAALTGRHAPARLPVAAPSHSGSGSSSSALAIAPELMAPLPLSMRPATGADLARVKVLERSLFQGVDCWAESMDNLQTNNVILLVACLSSGSLKGAEDLSSGSAPEQQQQQEEIAGYLIVTFSSLNLHVNKVAVDPRFRRMGIASALLKEGYTRAGSGGRRCLSASLNVALNNAAALKLYEAQGFIQDALLEDYYGNGRPGVRMTLDLAEWRERQLQQE